MHVCVLMPVLDTFKGGNHLPLLGACPSVQFTVLTNRTKPQNPVLPPNVRVLTLPARIGSYYGGFADALFAQSVLRTYPPRHAFWTQFDVIHLNQTFGPALRRLRETGRPVCLLIHHPVTVDRALAMQESRWPVTLLWRLKYVLLWRWQRALCRSGIAVVTVSRTAAERIASDYGLDVSGIRVVPNGIEGGGAPSVSPAKTEFDVIAIGSFLHPRKGFPYLLKVYQSLSAAGYRLADVGRRSEQQKAQLSHIPHLRVFGTVGQEELLSLLGRSSALVSTALYEGFGLSLIEALAHGRPAFAFGGGAVEEVLSPIDPRLVSPLRDTAELVRRVQEFLRLPEAQRRERGENYRHAVLDRYSLVRSGQALQEFYDVLCRSTPIFRG